MKLFNAGRILSMGAVALLFATTQKTGMAEPVEETTGWVITAADSTGGNFIVNGSSSVGQLTSFTSPSTSANGGDFVTLSTGGTAVGTNGATIEFDTPNDTLVIHGTVLGANDDGPDSRFVNTGVGYYSGSSINNQLLINTGNIYGGNGIGDLTTGIANTAVGFQADNGIYNITITNSGGIFGGSVVGDGTFPGVELSIGSGIVLYDGGAPLDINGVSITNSGIVSGGNGASDAYVTGAGVAVVSVGSVLNVSILNTSSGAFLGGSDNEGSEELTRFAVAGAGLGIVAGADGGSGKSVNGFLINNAGIIAGGNNNAGAYIVGSGIGIWGGNGVYNGAIINSGLVSGGDNNHDGTLEGVGIGVFDRNFLVGDVNGITIVNSGIVQGGNSNGDEVEANVAGVGIAVGGQSNVYNVSIFNSGVVTGGNNNTEAAFTGDGIVVSNLTGNISNITIVNTGIVIGGNSADGGGDGIYVGPRILEDGTGSNYTITNGYGGYIQGGNGLDGATAGQGIHTIGNDVTINNYGVVAAGSGLSQATTAGFPAVAISVSGSNNTINLNGHSSVLGTLQGANGTNNVLNLNFTGLSPQAIANIKSQLAAEGYPATNDFTGTFTVRGVTYYVDPLSLNLNLTSYQTQGLTPNQTSVAMNLDSIPVNPTGGLLALYNAIDASGDLPAALEALSPQRYQIYGDIAQATATFMSLSIDERLNNLRNGSESIDTTGMGGGSSETTTAGYDKDGKTVVVPDQKSMERRWGFFTEGSGLFTNIDAHGGDLSNQGFTSEGLLLGVDGKITDNLVAGLLFDYSATTADLDNVGSRADVQSLGGGIYSGYHNGGWYANGLAAYGSNTYNSTRDVIFPGFSSFAFSNTDGNQEEVNIDGGYDFHPCDKVTVGPLAGLQYVHLDVDGFNEVGAGPADLAVGSQSVDSLRSRVGFHAEYRSQIAKEVAFATEAHVAWQHEFLDNSYLIGSDFIGSGLSPFGVETTNPQRDSALLGVSANFTIRDRMTLFFDYDVQAGQQSYLEQTVKGGVKLSF